MEEAIPVTGGATDAETLPCELVDDMFEIAGLMGRPWMARLPNAAVSRPPYGKIRISVG